MKIRKELEEHVTYIHLIVRKIDIERKGGSTI